jgi:ribonuclease BN (tRNA processing enzyme)
MEIQILGAHNIESKDTGLATLLIDDILAIDTGALTTNLSLEEQLKLKAVLLTHQHYDHIRGIPAIGMTFFLHQQNLNVYGTQPVYQALVAHFLSSAVYSNFLEEPAGNPTITFKFLKAGREEIIEGYRVLPVPVDHSKPTVGFQITSPEGKTMFYTSDTGPGLVEAWQQVEPELLITELTAPNKWEDSAIEKKHLSPSLLRNELMSFRDIRGYLPRVITVHMNPIEEKAIAGETAEVAGDLNADISLGYEGMKIQL